MAADKELGSSTQLPAAKEALTEVSRAQENEETEPVGGTKQLESIHLQKDKPSGIDQRECSAEREILDSPKGKMGDETANTSAGFDMRSIHQHPPSPTAEQKKRVDPAWDTSKDAFEEATDNPALRTNTVILEACVFSPNEEKKEREVTEANTGISQPDDWETCGPGFEAADTNEELILDNGLMASENDGMEVTFAHLSLSALDEKEAEPDVDERPESNVQALPKEDEPLLEASSLHETQTEKPAMSMEERIKMYESIPRYNDSSSDDDSESPHSDDEEEEDTEVAYVDQNSDDDEEDETPYFVDNEDTFRNAPFGFTGPTFGAAAEAAASANLEIPPNDSIEVQFDSPKASPTRVERTTSKLDAGTKKSIPLIAPPPEGKLKKWEEQQTRGQKHLAALKAGREIRGEEFSKEQPDAPDLPPDRPKVTRSQSGENDTMSGGFGSPETKRSVESKLSPSGSILADQKMADKIALASSAAALTFEEKYQQTDTIVEPSVRAIRSTTEDSYMPSNDMLCGAFTAWEETSIFEDQSELLAQESPARDQISKVPVLQNEERMFWFMKHVFNWTDPESMEYYKDTAAIRGLLDENSNFNLVCQYVADCVNKVTSELGMASSLDVSSVEELTGKSLTGRLGDNIDSMVEKKRPWLKPMTLSNTTWNHTSATVAAANFVNFLFLASKLSKVSSPFGDRNPFIDELVTNSLAESEVEIGKTDHLSPQRMIFEHPRGEVHGIVEFVYLVSAASESQREAAAVQKLNQSLRSGNFNLPPKPRIEPATPNIRNKAGGGRSRRFVVPEAHPSPFEASVWNCPSILAAFLSFLGDPVAVSRMKMVNRFCCRIVSENEHIIMQDAVRTGGISMNVRPAFWMWITLQKFHEDDATTTVPHVENDPMRNMEKMQHLADRGRNGKWQHVIERDVARSFGNMPPHKTIAKLQDDSIVRALVTWGQGRIMKRGVKGGGEPVPTPKLGPKEQRRDKGKPPRNSSVGNMSSPPWICSGNLSLDDTDQLRIDTAVSDWSGVSPVPSFTGSYAESLERTNSRQFSETGQMLPLDELALGGNCLTNDVKVDLQSKLRFILHSLAAAHEDVGYCQGMDYVVAHLLRILQDTVMWKASKGTLPARITTAPALGEASNLEFQDQQRMYEEVDNSLVVEEVVFRVMDTFFTTYNLRHIYWPELRCLKTFCRVFERLIQIKLPVLADHFEHHDLNVGLFALGWFQTLFLYLPSMPSATVCHMWDIWLVERSFKIFFRVGTAILFLSQPTLLNNELEGMMTYLNTFPDATLLKPDILIPCALNIKVTNRLLQELEEEVTAAL
eukprot:scaffold22586_cov138-Cylindrotheca_fusiformis.AAC.2